MNSYTIRACRESDYVGAAAVCVGVGDGPMMQIPGMKEALPEVFCRYYIEKEPDNCFAAVDVSDRILGYVLCAANFDRWEQIFRTEYMQTSSNPIVPAMGEGTIEALRPCAAEYPAHLHIDLMPQLQGQGAGTALMRTLEAHLRERNVPGLCLNVAVDNENAIRFYRKLGYEEIDRSEQEIAMGKKL